ncbi:serine hydrolase domain-containing protein [Geodermatophilus marinus]|uniref:serine hydrolase domain-containing protein n=1 Tax=Geodermatophilus sp. LHW52908 TaxID=2303986 RepID=UPI000E3EBD4B|nr:serine hydrolase domain-containing protein [Geodermatophilus sp. LHW52908]RFU20314.1 class A beta-lactamase-related serine hydrolase [Geodermatophilus sp. LHW52908]
MRRLLSLLALGSATLLVLGVGGPAQARVPVGSIEDVVDRELAPSGVPGLAYAVVADGRITSVGGRGVVRGGGDVEVTPDTAFVTGSISKSFTALAVMQLVEAGEVDPDAEVSRYLDTFSGRPAGAITVRQLLSHTSGFSTLQGNVSHTDTTGGADELARRVDRLAAATPAYAPGEKWEYSNANYEILGRLVEVVSGQEFQDYVATNVLEPVGMEHSFVADGEVHPAMATGHTPWFGAKRPLPTGVTERGTAPQGGIVASAGDLARYLLVMMNGEDDVLSAAGKASMMRPAGGASPFYGFGWFVDSGNGRVWHSGSTPGFESLATMVPAEGKGVVVLVNGGSGVGFGETAQLRNGITAAALGFDYEGEGSRIFQKALFVALVLLPVIYLLSMVWAWRHRGEIRAKSGAFGLFSLWFPLLTTAGAAWVVLDLVPRLLGSPLRTIRLFQPDLGLAMTATAVTGVLWAVFRLAVAYTGRSGSS